MPRPPRDHVGGQVTARTVPYDTEAEESIAGSAIIFRDRRDVLDALDPEDFYNQDLSRLWGVMQHLRQSGASIDQVSVADEYADKGWPFDLTRFIHLTNVTIGANDHHVGIVLRHSMARRLIGVNAETTDELYKRADPSTVADEIVSRVGAIGVPTQGREQLARTLDDVVDNAEKSTPWIIPGLFRRDWRVVIVGGEGQGKSVLTRQIAVCASQGIHPFTHQRIDPIRVLIVDLENPDAAVAETGLPMLRQASITAGDDYDPSRVRYHQRLDGIDFRSRRDRAQIENEIQIHQPDLLIIGPAYQMLPKKMNGGHSENDEEATLPVIRAINELRSRYGCAVLIETHKGHGNDMRPRGSSLWLGWSEIGIALTPSKEHRGTLNLERYRGDRLLNAWPDSISRAQDWPWSATWKHGMPKTDAPLPIDEAF